MAFALASHQPRISRWRALNPSKCREALDFMPFEPHMRRMVSAVRQASRLLRLAAAILAAVAVLVGFTGGISGHQHGAKAHVIEHVAVDHARHHAGAQACEAEASAVGVKHHAEMPCKHCDHAGGCVADAWPTPQSAVPNRLAGLRSLPAKGERLEGAEPSFYGRPPKTV